MYRYLVFLVYIIVMCSIENKEIGLFEELYFAINGKQQWTSLCLPSNAYKTSDKHITMEETNNFIISTTVMTWQKYVPTHF